MDKRHPICFLYAITCNEALKIGASSSPLRRLETLQTANPYDLDLARLWIGPSRHVFEAEKRLKEGLCHAQIRGEWYYMSPEALPDLLQEFCPQENRSYLQVIPRPSTLSAHDIKRLIQEKILEHKRGYRGQMPYGLRDLRPSITATSKGSTE